jgi:molybdopterin-guanine dinucleotide biosynthesis protein MobB
MKTPWLLHPQELAFCGYSNTGKTTLLERLTSAFAASGLAIAYLKHDAHHFDLDREGKDTDRLAKAGARPVFISSAQESAKLRGPGIEGPHPSPLVAFDFLDADLLLVEGWKRAGLPRVAVLDAELALLSDPCWSEADPIALVGPWPSEPAAVAAWRGQSTRDRAPSRVPYFHRDAIASLAEWLLSRTRKRLSDRPLLGLVLSGGRSERMGTDKAELRLGTRSQLDEACALLEGVCAEVLVSCRQEQSASPSRAGKRLLLDRFAGFGPLGGILTAMHTRPEAAWFVLACDLPFLDQELVSDLHQARDGLRLATAYAGTDGLPEPLCTIWEPHALPRLHQFLGLGIGCPRKILLGSRIRLVQAKHPERLENVNERARCEEIAKTCASETLPASTTAPSSASSPQTTRTVAELDELLQRLPLPELPTESIRAESAVGFVLANAITADLDQPPFHRAAMDGVALRAGSVHPDLQQARLTSQRVRAAGDTWIAPADESCCEIMTGAALPEGFDTVIPYEDLQEISSTAAGSPSAIRQFSVRAEAHVRPGQNVHLRASDYRAGDTLIEPPWRIQAADVHTLVSTGHRQVAVRRKPSVGILATGSEILDQDNSSRRSLGPSSIRASNHLAIAAELTAAGWTQSEAICCEDIEERIKERIAELLRKHDVVLITGGVSKGRFDFVPRILEKIGVVTHAHGVALKPGKPLLVGTFARPAKTSTVPVFGLPGNPVSCLVTLRRFVLPLLRRWEGCPEKAILRRISSWRG